jgi:hypothetical protein
MLHQIIYLSHSVVTMSSAELIELLEKSRRNNLALGITGLLLHADRSFIQTIEGEPDAVRTLLAKIKRDPRHAGLTLVADEPVESRSFGDWSMAFREITRNEAAMIPGFLQDQANLTPADKDLARTLMLTFFRTSGFA